MHITLTINDDDRFEESAEDTPWTLTMSTDATNDELIEIGSEIALIGEDIPTMLRELADTWPASRSDRNQLVTLDLAIDNVYPDDAVRTTVDSVIAPAPVDPRDEDGLSMWAFDHLFNYTGTGQERADEDAIYVIEITGSSDAALQGRTITIGG